MPGPKIPRRRAANPLRPGTNAMPEPISDASAAPSPGAYELRYAPCAKRVRVEFEGRWIADSQRALVLHETRLPPAYYFPFEDVRMDLLRKTDFHTHCPFKGNASYWTLDAGGKAVENVAWAYEDPFPDAGRLRGHLSFYRGKVSALYEGDDEVPFLATPGEGAHGNPLAAWLLKDAWQAASSAELAEQFFVFLCGAGYPVARSTIIIPTLHPQIFATVFVWRADTLGVRVVYEPHDILRQARFADSPFAPIIRGAGGVRRRLEDADVKLDFPVVRDLHKEGATDYVAMPFRFSDGQINVISMTSFTRGGFGAAQLGQVYEIMPMLGRVFEVHAQRRIAMVLLETYLGRSTGKRVLDGLVKLGDGEHIPGGLERRGVERLGHQGVFPHEEQVAVLASRRRREVSHAGAVSQQPPAVRRLERGQVNAADQKQTASVAAEDMVDRCPLEQRLGQVCGLQDEHRQNAEECVLLVGQQIYEEALDDAPVEDLAGVLVAMSESAAAGGLLSPHLTRPVAQPHHGDASAAPDPPAAAPASSSWSRSCASKI